MTTVIPEPDIIIKQDLIEPTDDETEWAIQMLKNGKSPGEDDIVSELLKKRRSSFNTTDGKFNSENMEGRNIVSTMEYFYFMPNIQKGRCVGLQKL